MIIGIPENEELANTYYSQYDDFSNSDDDSEDEDENQKTVINRNTEMPAGDATLVDKNQLTVNSLDDGTLKSHSNDEDQFFNCLQDVLEQGDDAGRSKVMG